MSVASSSKGKIPKRSSLTRSQLPARPSTSKGVVASQKSSASMKKAKESQLSAPQASSTQKEFQLPAFSVPYVPKPTNSELDKIKKKTIRRNAPPGEDLKGIKAILKSIKGENVTVQEFISLIAPSTGDSGEVLRVVMNEDLVAFRKLARKVYETITQDNSDVLLNQQLQIIDYYKEKKNLLNARMMNAIEEIYSLAPTFNFDRYAAEKEKYLLELFPIPPEVKVEPEEMEMLKRQAAYHRLQWLRSEGERLNEENNSLKKRLKQMKRMHMEEQHKMAEMEQMAEAKKQALEAAQAQKEETLDILNQSLEKSIIVQEMSLRQEKDREVLVPIPAKTGAIRKKSKTKVRKIKRPAWNSEAAADIEGRVLQESRASEARKVAEPFHFSPIKTPPTEPQKPRELSPFHYSPPKSPPRVPYDPPPAAPALRVEENPHFYLPSGRKTLAPRDSWGGFY